MACLVSCAGVAPSSAPIARTSSTSARFRRKFSSVNVDDGAVVRVAQLVVADAEEDAHALGRREGQIDPGNPFRDDAPECLPGHGMLAAEHAVELRGPTVPFRRSAAAPSP